MVIKVITVVTVIVAVVWMIMGVNLSVRLFEKHKNQPDRILKNIWILMIVCTVGVTLHFVRAIYATQVRGLLFQLMNWGAPFALLFLAFFSYFHMMRRFRPVVHAFRERHNLCIQCGYDLQGQDQALKILRCPECGTEKSLKIS